MVLAQTSTPHLLLRDKINEVTNKTPARNAQFEELLDWLRRSPRAADAS
jgi:hypothetical protein